MINGIVLAAFFFIQGACTSIPKQTPHTAEDIPQTQKPLMRPETKTPDLTKTVVGYSVEKRPIELYSIGRGEEVILIFAAIHGNEQAGISLSTTLIEKLKNRPDVLEGRRILIMPVTNPDGVIRKTRANANGVDLNRNFDSANRRNTPGFGMTPLSEPEARIIYETVKAGKPQRILSIHQPLNCLDYNKWSLDLADRMAEFCPLPLKRLRSHPGSFGSWAGNDLQIPIITMELTAADDNLNQDQLWKKYGLAVLAFITFPDIPY